MALNKVEKIMREESGVGKQREFRESSGGRLALRARIFKCVDCLAEKIQTRVEDVMHGYLQAGDRPADFGLIRSGTKSC